MTKLEDIGMLNGISSSYIYIHFLIGIKQILQKKIFAFFFGTWEMEEN